MGSGDTGELMTIEHDPAKHRFTITLPEGGGDVRYRIRPDGVWEVYHTEVDPGLRGRGVAGQLALGLVDYARANGIKLKVTCPFVKSWLVKHPEAGDVVAA